MNHWSNNQKMLVLLVGMAGLWYFTGWETGIIIAIGFMTFIMYPFFFPTDGSRSDDSNGRRDIDPREATGESGWGE